MLNAVKRLAEAFVMLNEVKHLSVGIAILR